MSTTDNPINLTTAWQAPPVPWLVLQNCSAATDWAAAAGQAISKNATSNDVPSGITIAYLKSMIPSNWTDKPSDADLLVWYTDVLNNETLINENDGDNTLYYFLSDMFYFPIYDCNQTICSKLDWEGDPDVSGIGMLVSYYFVALLTSLYFIALVTGGLPYFNKTASRASKTIKSLRGFLESVDEFLDSALIFAASMLIAAITRYHSVIKYPTRTYSVFSLIGSVFMSAFSIFPALILQTLADRVRRHWLRIVLWLLVMATAITVEVMYSKVYKDQEWGLDLKDDETRYETEYLEIVWLEVCEDQDIRKGIETTLTVGHVLLGINTIWWLKYFLFSLTPPGMEAKIKATRAHRYYSVVKPWLLFANGLACCAMMWAFLGLFMQYTLSFRSVVGKSDRDGDWTFGQVLAIATWVPVVVQFLSVSFFGKKSINAKVSKRYKIVEAQDFDDLEMRENTAEHQQQHVHHEPSTWPLARD